MGELRLPLEHPAIGAWRKLRPRRVEPDRFDVLKEESQKTAVYRLSGVGKADSAVIAKRCRHNVALIERTVYEEILPSLPFPMLHYYGCVEEPNGEFCWLFVEDVSGDEKYQPSYKRHRVAAARWLGIMNISATGIAAATRLPERRSGHYLKLLRSARDTILTSFANPALNDHDRALLNTILAHCEHLSGHWRKAVCVCDGMPQTLVHGDFIKNNVGVRTGRNGIMFLPFDWEKAGWGIPAEDISRVDLPTYWSIVRAHWPRLSSQAVGRLANVGRAFRCLVFLDWIAPSLHYETIDQSMNELRRCESWLGDVFRAAVWQD
jgi:hypothetical protein